MTLSRETKDIILATVPVLEEHGVAITTVFYKRMFEAHPELLNIFNEANQAQGRQQSALAMMVYQAAKHIDNLEAVVPQVMLVAHKHRSLTVQPEHYPIVGKYLLLAIQEVLGDAATPDIMQAWEETYGVIANIFIDVERQLYEASAWEDFKPFIVKKKEVESELVTSFYLEPKDGLPLPTYEAGQYITVRLHTGGEYLANRQYTISCAPNGQTFRISVKREPNGRVSNYLHDHVQVGDELEVTAPAGDFYLEKAERITLLSAGVGITPMMAMAEAARGQVDFIHTSKSKAVQPFISILPNIVEQGIYIYTDESPRIDERVLRDYVHNGTYYICGPEGFMRDMKEGLLQQGVKEDQIRIEYFGPAIA